MAFSMILGYFLAHESVLARVACDGLTRYFLARPFLRPNIWPFKTLFGPKAILTGKFDPQSFIWTHIWLLSRYFNVKKIRREILETKYFYVKLSYEATARHDFTEKKTVGVVVTW